MATLDKIFTNQATNVRIGATSIRFDKLFLRKGDIDEIEFILKWEAPDPSNNGVTVSHSVPFRPSGFTDLSVPPSDMFVFRQSFAPPVFQIGENSGLDIVAYSDNGNPFDLTLFFEFEVPRPKK